MPILVTTWFGTFLLDENGKVLKHRLFPKHRTELAKRLILISDTRILTEERELAKKVEGLIVTEPRLQSLGILREDLRFALKPEDYGFTFTLYHDAMVELAKLKMSAAIGPDTHLIQALNALDSLNRATNLLSERLHEWYGYYFPELALVTKEPEFVDLVATVCNREKIRAQKKALFDREGIQLYGGSCSEETLNQFQKLAAGLRELYCIKTVLEKYIETEAKRIAPNLAYLAGPVLGARLITLAGSLEKLALLPASTIQVLGAEQALFKHLRSGAKGPKHGVLFQHPLIHTLPKRERGKLARSFAAALAISARVDAFGKKHKKQFIAVELEQKLKKRLEKLSSK